MKAFIYAGKHYGAPHEVLLETDTLVTAIHEESGDVVTVHKCDVEWEDLYAPDPKES